MKIRYNLFILIGRTLFIAFMITLLVAIIVFIVRDGEFKRLLVAIPFLLLFAFFIASFANSIFRETYSLTVENKKLILYRPIFGTKKVIDFNAIRGYSKSEVKFGAHWGQSLYRSRSIILYSKNFEPFEFISFNYWAFSNLEDKFRELELPVLGFEEYKTGFLFRKYTFQ